MINATESIFLLIIQANFITFFIMIAKKTILSLAIICLLLNLANAFRIKKLASAAPNSIATRRPKPIQTIRVYRTIRRFVIYCWGKNQFKNF